MKSMSWLDIASRLYLLGAPPWKNEPGPHRGHLGRTRPKAEGRGARNYLQRGIGPLQGGQVGNQAAA